MEKDHYTWDQLHADCKALAKEITDSGIEITHVYGIPRGGLVPAVVMSHLLDLPMTYDTEMVGEKTLVVDDICDTGQTYARLSSVIHTHAPFAALYYNKEHDEEPDFWINEKKNWVVFPWETDKTSRYDDTMKH